MRGRSSLNTRVRCRTPSPRIRATASVVLSYKIDCGTLHKEIEPGVVPVTKRFAGLRRIGPHKTRVAGCGRSIAKKWILRSTPAISLRQRLAKIYLRMARIVPQRNKYLAMRAAAASTHSP